jgi:RNA polymerase sigma-70 factor, ECF subfamily
VAGLLRDVEILPGLALTDAPASRAALLEQDVVELFDALRNPVLRYLMGFGLAVVDCEEIVQETFLALFLHLQQGRSRRNLRSWLFRVAHNLGLKKLQRSRRESTSVESWESAIDPAPNPEAQFSDGQLQRKLRAVFDALPEQSRRCLLLRAEGLRYREIAEVLDMSLGAVSLSLSRSFARMMAVAER